MSKKPVYGHMPLAELRDFQATLLRQLGKARPNGFEWKFFTTQLDDVNRSLAARR